MQKNKNNLWKNINLQKIFILTIILIVPIFFLGLFLYRTQISHPAQAQLVSHSLNEAKTKNISLGESLPVKIKPEEFLPVKTPIIEIHIANNGALLLRGAEVISISKTIIRVATTWDSTELIWEIQTNPFTKFLTSKNEKLDLTNIEIGNTLTITGKLIKSGLEPTINAQIIRK